MSEKHGDHWLEREDFGDVTVVRFKTPRVMDEDNSAVFDSLYALSKMGRNKLVLNFAICEYITSMGLGKMVMLNRKVQAANGRLALCQLDAAVEEIFDITHLLPLFNVYATEQAAIESFA
jgi:anti-sigma B factor antagonist